MAISFETALPSVEQFDDRIATLVYAELLERLGAKGHWNAFAGIALPNDASVALHERPGSK